MPRGRHLERPRHPRRRPRIAGVIVALVLVSEACARSPPRPGVPADGARLDVDTHARALPDAQPVVPPIPRPSPSRARRALQWLTPEQKRRAEQLTSVFENGTPEIQYGYTQALGDGRGYTVGRGFTTGTGDALEVVRSYTRKYPGNPLAKFLPKLEALANAAGANSGDVRGLAPFAKTWADAARNPLFRTTQDEVYDRLCYDVAMRLADAEGLETPLARTVVYDTVVMHGGEDAVDPDGTIALLARTRARAGGSPRTGVDERAWLRAFLAIRRATVAHAANEATRKTWAEAVGRCDVLAAIEASGNYELRGPIAVDQGGFEAIVP